MRSFSTDSQNLKTKTDMPLVRALTARAEEPSWRWCKTGSTQCVSLCDAPSDAKMYQACPGYTNHLLQVWMCLAIKSQAYVFFYLSAHKGEFDATGHCGECPWRGQRQNVTRVQVCVENQKVAIFQLQIIWHRCPPRQSSFTIAQCIFALTR